MGWVATLCNYEEVCVIPGMSSEDCVCSKFGHVAYGLAFLVVLPSPPPIHDWSPDRLNTSVCRMLKLNNVMGDLSGQNDETWDQLEVSWSTPMKGYPNLTGVGRLILGVGGTIHTVEHHLNEREKGSRALASVHPSLCFLSVDAM